MIIFAKPVFTLYESIWIIYGKCFNIFLQITKPLVKNYFKGIKKTLNRHVLSHLLECDGLFCGDEWKIRANFFTSTISGVSHFYCIIVSVLIFIL